MERKVFRCTRQKPYASKCIGNENTSARQGHYIESDSPENAILQMMRDFHEDVESGYGFTAQQSSPARGKLFEWSVNGGVQESALKGMA